MSLAIYASSQDARQPNAVEENGDHSEDTTVYKFQSSTVVKNPLLSGIIESRISMFPTRNTEMRVLLNIINKTRGTLSQCKRETNIIHEHLEEVSYKTHMDS